MMRLRAALIEQGRLLRKRQELMPASANTAECWAILLDLALAEFDERNISISSACIASGAPQSTALRHIALLVDAGLAERFADKSDNRRAFLRITEAGADIVLAAFRPVLSPAGNTASSGPYPPGPSCPLTSAPAGFIEFLHDLGRQFSERESLHASVVPSPFHAQEFSRA